MAANVEIVDLGLDLVDVRCRPMQGRRGCSGSQSRSGCCRQRRSESVCCRSCSCGQRSARPRCRARPSLEALFGLTPSMGGGGDGAGGRRRTLATSKVGRGPSAWRSCAWSVLHRGVSAHHEKLAAKHDLLMLVLRGALDVIDDKNVDGSFAGASLRPSWCITTDISCDMSSGSPGGGGG